MSNLPMKYQQQTNPQTAGPTLKDAGENQNISNPNNGQQYLQKKDNSSISLLQFQQKGTSLASVSQISKLIDDYGQYLNQQNNKLKMMQVSPKNQFQPIKKVFENMINTNINSNSTMSSQLSPVFLTKQQIKAKFRSHSDHKSSSINIQSQNSQFQSNAHQRENQNMIKRLNASKIFHNFANQDITETNSSLTQIGDIQSLYHRDIYNNNGYQNTTNMINSINANNQYNSIKNNHNQNNNFVNNQSKNIINLYNTNNNQNNCINSIMNNNINTNIINTYNKNINNTDNNQNNNISVQLNNENNIHNNLINSLQSHQNKNSINNIHSQNNNNFNNQVNDVSNTNKMSNHAEIQQPNQKNIFIQNKIFFDPDQSNTINLQNVILQKKNTTNGTQHTECNEYKEGKFENSGEEQQNKLNSTKKRRSQRNAISELTNPIQRQNYQYGEQFVIQDETSKAGNQSPVSHSLKTEEKGLLNLQINSGQQLLYSNLLKYNPNSKSQNINPKGQQISNSNKKQGDVENKDVCDSISAFQQLLTNQQNDPWDHAGFKGSLSMISNRKQDDLLNVTSVRRSQERVHRSGINPNKQALCIGPNFLPTVNSSINLQKSQSPSLNNDQSNISIVGLGNSPLAVDEQMKYSKEIYGKKYFRNLKIESLIKEYEKRNIKNLFESQILLSQKKNQIEISRALEEKKQKELKSLKAQGQIVYPKRNNELKICKENDSKILDNLQMALSKNVISNKLDKDIKRFRERTKSSLIRGLQEIQQNDLKIIDASAFVYGNPISNQQSLNNSSNQINYNNIKHLHTDVGHYSSNNDQNNHQIKPNLNYKYKQHFKRGHNSIDLTNNPNGFDNNDILSEIQQQVPYTSRNYNYQPMPFSSQQDELNLNLMKDKDILVNFLKNINIKKKYTKLQELYPQNQQTESSIYNKIENKQKIISPLMSPKQRIPFKTTEKTQNLQLNEQQSSLTNRKFDYNRLPVNQLDEQLSTDSNSQKLAGSINTSKLKISQNKKQKINNIKTLGVESLYDQDEEDNATGGWETKTTSNFDQLYGLFQ